MKLLIPIKRVLDYNIKPRPKSDGSGAELTGMKMSMNPFDEIALEEAIRLKEKGVATEVVAVTCGSNASQDILRTALALGADRAILIESEIELEPLSIAKCLSTLIKKETPQLVIAGKQAIDDDSNQTGQMLAALLDWPQATFASNIEVEGSSILVTREIDGGLETLAMSLPAVVTSDLRLNEPRFATLPNIMKAKKKPLDTIQVKELLPDITNKIKVLSVAEPVARAAGIKVDSIDMLLDQLKNQAKVIA